MKTAVAIIIVNKIIEIINLTTMKMCMEMWLCFHWLKLGGLSMHNMLWSPLYWITNTIF